MSEPLFDHDLRRARMARRGEPDNVLMPRIAEELALRIGAVLREFHRIVDLETPAPDLATALSALDNMHGPVLRAGRDEGVAVVCDDALPFATGSLDLVVSALALHWVEDLPGRLVQIRRALKGDGLFMAALPGGETLTELRQAFAQAETEIEGGASPRVIPFADVRDIGSLLQRTGYALPVIDTDRFTVRYRDLSGLFRDLRALGAANPLNARRRVPLRRATLQRLSEIYAERFSDPDGRLRATVEIVWVSGWAPHESQQKPLRPGSAQQRLADALGTQELPSGVKPGG